MSEINIENYFKSINSLNGTYFTGDSLREQMSIFQEWHKEIELVPEEETFYAIGMFGVHVDERLYFFNEKRMKILYLDFKGSNKIRNIKIKEFQYSDIEKLTLDLFEREMVTLSITFKNSNVKVVLNSQEDAHGKWSGKHSQQIKKIYNLIMK